MAEGVGFEPTVPCSTTVFKTAALNHSATPPRSKTISYTIRGKCASVLRSYLRSYRSAGGPFSSVDGRNPIKSARKVAGTRPYLAIQAIQGMQGEMWRTAQAVWAG